MKILSAIPHKILILFPTGWIQFDVFRDRVIILLDLDVTLLDPLVTVYDAATDKVPAFVHRLMRLVTDDLNAPMIVESEPAVGFPNPVGTRRAVSPCHAGLFLSLSTIQIIA